MEIFNRELPPTELPCWSPDRPKSYLFLKREFSNAEIEIVWNPRTNSYWAKFSDDEDLLDFQAKTKKIVQEFSQFMEMAFLGLSTSARLSAQSFERFSSSVIALNEKIRATDTIKINSDENKTHG